ncbi:hypothetical protein QBC46DRAFT_351128 [Diplogelasinospora grovesii]|uniref:Dicer-like protein 1 n=1 Tax=Diplogelasinospora grovesii TaxID=303347 RepID=A0AAN6NDM9_9PEZI|nr:hypothetical protein QBC46DRAFT_351128 [Diplogelasinospora grovesii]
MEEHAGPEAAILPSDTQFASAEDDLNSDSTRLTFSSPEIPQSTSDGSPVDKEEDASDQDSDSSVKKWVLNEPRKPRKISQKKRADAAAFEAWLEQNQQKLSRCPNKPSLDEEKSVNLLVRDYENKKIITSPRDYQLELFELAKTQNTIAVLDTGSGKTLIAALLLRWTIQNELEDRAQGQPKRISFFLVDKVALVFQQHAVLVCNLDYPVEKLCGEMIDAVSSREFWKKTFEENMAIVCTAEILASCLHHSFIRMEQINLLVFDEAHHTKKNHPYARIIKEFYINPKEGEKRPRILGMTASPVDAQIDPRKAAAELETLLHSQIATIANPTTLQQTVCKPKQEIMVSYDPKPSDWETPLHQSLKALIGGHELFRKPLIFSRAATAELGPWCADRYWQLFFREADSIKLEARTEMHFVRESASSQTMNEHMEQLRKAAELVRNHEFSRPAVDRNLLSSKVTELVFTLQQHFRGVDSNRRCIVFVKQRNTALMLADLLRQPEMEIPGLEVGVLIGAGNATDSGNSDTKFGFRDQVLTVYKFKRGELNCIFATSVAEEGLDIPDCNIIIRFDLYDTLIQYIQSRGRARQEGSLYVHMLEKGNGEHRRKMQQNKLNEDALRRFCEALPEDRKLTGHNYTMDYLLRKGGVQRQYIVPETGAKLNYKQSLIILASFVASLPHPPEISLVPEYVITPAPGGFQCEVLLPSVSPVRNATGKVHTTKAVAKCSAAFEICLALIKGKHLDAHLQPAFTKQLHKMRNARLAISCRRKGEYGMLTKPKLWSTLGEPTQLYATAVTLTTPAALGRSSTPLLLMTRQSIPQVAPFPLYFGTDRSSEVRCTPIPGPLEVGEEDAGRLAAFTLKVFCDVFSKEYEATTAELPYFLAPIRGKDHAFDFTAVKHLREIIDWNTLGSVQETQRLPYDLDEHFDDGFFKDKFLVDPWDGSRKFYTRGRRHDLKPTDPAPDGVVQPTSRAWKLLPQEKRDILNYSVSLWSKSRARTNFRDDQPVVEAELLPTRRNLLDENIEDVETDAKRCFLILEPLNISPLPVDVVAMALNLPAIIYRIDSNLIALDGCKVLGLEGIRANLALEAFTKDSDNSDEHDNPEKINFQSGMGENYERHEFLGDSFLKMATTISIYTLIPDKDECEYHIERMLLICNQNLFANALSVKLEEHIRSQSFSRRTWYPEGLTLKKGKRTNPVNKHSLADKSIADVCEAVIGAAYLSCPRSEDGSVDFDLAVRAVTAVTNNDRHRMTCWADYFAAYQKPSWQTAPANSTQQDMADRFARRLGYAFKWPRLLRCAFQHPTYPNMYEKLPSYQRLEFLGDALLDMVCVDFLFHRFPGADPQWLTEHKMAMVSNQFLGCLAVMLGFNKAMTFCSPSIQRDMGEYVTEIEEALRTAKEDAVKQGKEEGEFAKDFWVHCSRPPKCLPDVVEAYVGAVFVDSEYDYGVVQKFFDERVKPFFENMQLYDTFANKHPVTFLANLMTNKFRCADWRLLVKEVILGDGGGEGVEGAVGGETTATSLAMGGTPQVVCAVRVHGRTLTHAVAASSRYAKMAAAKKALQMLEDVSLEKFREEHACQCIIKGNTKESGSGPGSESGSGEVDVEAKVELHGSAI